MKKARGPNRERYVHVPLSDEEYKILQELKEYYEKPMTEIIRFLIQEDYELIGAIPKF